MYGAVRKSCRQFDIELTKTERDRKLKNLFWNLSVQFRKNMNKFSIHRPNDIEFKIFVHNQAIWYRINQNGEWSKTKEFSLKFKLPFLL